MIAAPTITITPAAGALPGVQAGNSYSQTFSASGGVGPRTFALTAGALPPGLSLTSGGALSGTPTASGTFNFAITATDSAPTPFSSAPVAYSLTVTAPTITVSPAALPGGTTAAAYSQTFTASGGIGAYAYSVTAGALPPGLILGGDTLSGAPTAAGTYNFTITATDSLGFTGARGYSILMADPVVIITGPAAGALPGATAGQLYAAQTFTASGGQGAHSFALVAGALPPGMSLTSSGILSGTPSTPGLYNFSIAASDSSPAPGPFSSTPVAYSVSVVAPLIVVSPTSLPPMTTAANYSETFTASGGVGPYSFAITAGSLPPGLTLSGNTLSGVSTAAGSYPFTVTATDSSGFTGSQPFILSGADPVITVTGPSAGTLPGASAGTAYNQTFTASGGQGSHSFTLAAGALPPGLTLSSDGLLAGAPTAIGTFNFAVEARDSSPAPGPFVSAQVAYSLTVTAPTVTVSPSSLPDGTTAAAYSQTFTASGGAGPYSFAVTAGALPGGLALAADGALIGTPNAAGAFSFTVTATDALGFMGDQVISVTIADPTVTVTAPTAGALVSGQVGTTYSQTFTATGGQGTHSFALDSGALPAGLTLSAAGELSGSPTQAGVFSFSVIAADASPTPGPFISTPVAYTLEIAGPTIVLTPAAGALPTGQRTVAYSQTFAASGGAAPYAFSVTAGVLPAGLTLASDGTLSGTPEAAGDHDFTVTATDAMGFAQAAAYTLEVGTPVPVVQPKTAETIGGQSVTIDVTQGAIGVDIISVSVASPPSNGVAVVQGLTIIYTANPDFSGTDSFTYTVSNAGGASTPATVTITVAPALTTGPEKTVTVLAGLTAVVDLMDGATGGPFTGAAVVSMTPTDAGATSIRERTGPNGPLYDLVFTPADDFSGQATVLYTLSNAFTTSAPGTVTITVEPRLDPSLDPDVRGVASSQVNAARRFADAQIDNFQRRLRDLRDGDNASSNGLSLNLGRDEDLDPRQALRRELGVRDHDQAPGAQTPNLERDMMGLDIWAGRRGSSGDHSGAAGTGGDGALGAAVSEGARNGNGDSVGFWVAGAVDWGRQDATGVRDSRFTTHGVTVGVDTRLSDRLIVGGGVGYGEDKTRIGDKGSVSNGRALSGALYASWRPAEAIYLDGVIGLADLDFDSRRWASGLAGQPDAFVDGRRSGEVVFTSATIGRLVRRSGWTTDIYARLDARETTLDAFTETGGGLSALAWDEARQSSVSANLGAEWRWLVETRNFGSISPTLGLEWSYELEGVGTQGLRYADWAGSPTYWTPLDGWSRNALDLNLGAEWSLSDRLKLSFGYRGMLGDASSSHGGELRLDYRW